MSSTWYVDRPFGGDQEGYYDNLEYEAELERQRDEQAYGNVVGHDAEVASTHQREPVPDVDDGRYCYICGSSFNCTCF